MFLHITNRIYRGQELTHRFKKKKRLFDKQKHKTYVHLTLLTSLSVTCNKKGTPDLLGGLKRSFEGFV